MSLFDDFWEAFPRKRRTKKPTAQKKWKKLPVDIQELIVANVAERAEFDKKWLEDDGQYVPMPTTYLNNGCWLDEWERVKHKPTEGWVRDTTGDGYQPTFD